MSAVDNNERGHEAKADRAVLQRSAGVATWRSTVTAPTPAAPDPRRAGQGVVLGTDISGLRHDNMGKTIIKRRTMRGNMPAWQHNAGCYWAANELVEMVPAGLYRAIERPNVGICLKTMSIDTDELMELPDSPSQAVLAEIIEFWQLKDAFQKRGFIHKRGVMLWGPPGSGKTATLNQLIALVVNQYGGIGFFVDHAITAQHCLGMVRQIEPDRPIVALMEDLDALVGSDRDAENSYLALLDGEAQVANIVFVATTNYPERLDRRFTDRPSRFDLIKEIGMPSAASRLNYLQTKEPSLTQAELDEWVERTDGLSIAHLRELIILCRCYNKPLDKALARLRTMRNELPNSARANNGLGGGIGFIR